MIRVSAVLNTESGSLKDCDPAALEKRLVAALDGPRFELVGVHRTDRPIDAVLEEAVAEDSDCLLVGGGDGSVSATATAAWKSGKMLAVLPGGTMNLYARTLGMPLELDEAIDALPALAERRVDLATIDGTPFIHQFTVGLHADAVQLRQRSGHGSWLGSRVGKLLATTRAFAAVILSPPTFPVELEGDGVEGGRRRLSALSVSNNLFGEGHIPYADESDGGRLGLYCAEPLKPWTAARLMGDVMLGRFDSNENVGIRSATRIELRFPDPRRPARALLDGELVDVERRIEIRLHAAALRVLRPAGEAS